jgi:homocitrate synthase NifV
MTELDPGAIELSEEMYRLLSPLPWYPSYVLRLSRVADAAKYPHITEFVCPETAPSDDERICAEISIDKAGETGAITADDCPVYTKLRVVGLDDALCADYRQTFALLRRKHSFIDFCPKNRFRYATALAAEWALNGAGGGVVTTFGGLGGFAATEETIMILRMKGLRCANKNYGFLPEMARLFKKLAKKNVPTNKPVIGKRIFHVESGIHVDGILKQPMCYEPFPPEIVGQARKIVLGKQSGLASIRAKLSELKLQRPEEELPHILARVKAKAAENRGAVTDREFEAIVGGDVLIAPLADNGVDDANSRFCINGITSINPSQPQKASAALPLRYIVDTTLRDGEQTPGLCLSGRQKLEIAALLDSNGIHQIEAGVPAASWEDKETIADIIKNRRNAVISAWARLVPSDIEHAIDVRPDLIHVCVPVSQTQIREKLRVDEEQIIDRLRACLRVAEKSGIPLSAGFEDAFRADVNFMIRVAQTLLDSGVTRIRLSDTAGIASPSQCRMLLTKIDAKLNGKAALGIHAHNDLGMAVANTVEAAKSGCLYADATVGGIGERAGNCGLAQLVGASSPMFDWGITAAAARRLERGVRRVYSRFISRETQKSPSASSQTRATAQSGNRQ